ncbi:hypothetical protein F4775DRAFT_405116 [Biscogniauxia sp. FL1348]|nr:hypothetical protein F4775DRAFT_405116 [Biscogniauxia sp. FL1348]
MSSGIRFHHKSRKGCNNCKLRRVKCDEAKPRCASCVRRNAECLYVAAKRKSKSSSTGSTPGSTPHTDESATEGLLPTEQSSKLQSQSNDQQVYAQPHYSAKHLLDLRLMHHYVVYTTQDFAGASFAGIMDRMKIDLPQLALRHEFLMDSILYMAMVHLGSTDPASLETLPIYVYRDQALRSLREAISHTSQENSRATRAASILLAAVSFAASRLTKQPGLWITDWMTLATGQRNFSSSQRYSGLSHSEDNIQSPENPEARAEDIPIDILRAISKVENDYHCTDSSAVYAAAAELGRIITMLESAYERMALENRIKAWSFNIISPEFVEMFFPDMWIYQGLVSHDIEEIRQTIGPRWEEYLDIPITAVHLDDRNTLTRLLVGCLQSRPRTS